MSGGTTWQYLPEKVEQTEQTEQTERLEHAGIPSVPTLQETERTEVEQTVNGYGPPLTVADIERLNLCDLCLEPLSEPSEVPECVDEHASPQKSETTETDTCQTDGCGRQLMAPHSRQRGICESCYVHGPQD